MKNSAIYIHGKGGSAAEAEHYARFFDVIGFDYKSETPWDAAEEFPPFFELYRAKILIANSIGAFFAMAALAQKKFDAAFFISPVVDMEKLILGMLARGYVTESESREYLRWVRENPIRWQVPTHILYGENDALTSLATMKNFAEKTGATLTVMAGGEHWFHTPEQMAFLDKWLEEFL